MYAVTTLFLLKGNIWLIEFKAISRHSSFLFHKIELRRDYNKGRLYPIIEEQKYCYNLDFAFTKVSLPTFHYEPIGIDFVENRTVTQIRTVNRYLNKDENDI